MKKFLIVIAGVFGALLLMCGIGAVIAAVANSNDAKEKPNFVVVPSTTSSATPVAKSTNKLPAPQKTVAKINGDDIVHVGEDIPAGTYRTKDQVVDGSLCYWVKSSDSEARDIIANDLPQGGRPSVTLKNGQWFKSQGCPDWYQK